MGSPLSSIIAEIYLQHYEKLFIKHWIDSSVIKYYSRYVDDIFIIFVTRLVTEDTILNYMSNISKHLEFKITTQDNNTINYLDLTIIRRINRIELDIFQKPSTTRTTIHARSNHPEEHKTAAYRYSLRRLKTLPISNDKKSIERNIITQITHDNGYTHELVKQLNMLEQKQDNTLEPVRKKWTTFTHFSQAIRKINNIFKNTQLHISFCPINTIAKYTSGHSTPQSDLQKSGIYEIQCHTCNLRYIGQTSRDVITRFNEHCRYIKSKNPKSATLYTF
jgi:hypothetical protein